MNKAIHDKSILDKKEPWGLINSSLISGVYYYAKELSKFETCLLLYMVVDYNSRVGRGKTDELVNYSYAEFKKEFGCDISTIQRAIKRLESKDLITCINKATRKGRESFQYIPNKTQLSKYLL